jgi:glyoxylase I family protein
MLRLNKVHHIAIICSDYIASKKFYTEVMGLSIGAEHYRQDRGSWKLDLQLNAHYILELFSFPDAPPRLSSPEAAGLRHLAFEVDDVDESVAQLAKINIAVEPVRTDPYKGKRFTFFRDPDNLPIELYQK